ncbi:MAG: TolC family protein [Steroidobacteraceae bacterium]
MRWQLFFILLVTSRLAGAANQSPLPFDEAVERALGIAPQVSARAEGASAMRELAVSAGRLPDPALTVGVDNLPINGPDAGSTTADFMTMRTVGLMQEFPSRAKRRLERERASAEVDLAGAKLAETSLDVARATARAWIRRAALESVVENLRALRPEVELGAAAARAGVAAGRASTAQALAAEMAVVRLDNRIVEMETEAHHARIELARWIGADAERPLAPMPAFDRLPEPAAALLAGVERHGTILPFESRLAAARTDVERARANKRPDWSAGVSYGKRGPEFSDMASLQFTVGLPLFAKHRQDPVIAARNAELRQLEADRDATLRAHEAELHKMLVEWEQAGVRLERYDRELLPLGRERAAAALAAYRAGHGEFQLALDAFEDEIELAVERALLADTRGRAWAFLRYLEPRQLRP